MAIAIALGVAAAAGLAGSAISANAAQNAANTQAGAATAAAGDQLSMFNSIKQSLAPFLQLGAGAIPTLQAALPGLTTPFTGANLPQTPGYQFALQQGLQAAQSGFSSQGLSKSGPAIKGAINYAEGLAGTTYQSVFQNQLAQKGLTANILGSVIGGGQNAAAQQGGFGIQSQQSINNLLTSAAAAQAAGGVGVANAINSGLGGASNNLLLGTLLANQNPTVGTNPNDPTAGVTGVTGLPFNYSAHN